MVYPLHSLRLVVCCAIVAAALPGCAIYPLPGDIPKVPTSDIVERIRCEVQDGLRTFSQENPADRKLIAQLIKGTTIGYEFAFKMNEANTAPGGQFEFTETRFTGGTFGLEVRSSVDLKRDNTRAFIALEDLSKVNGADCSPETTRANWVYPITGATGMAEVVRSYLKLQLLTGLAKDTNSVSGFNSAQNLNDAVFSDALEYGTKLSVGITPHLELAAGVGRFRLTNASITGSASRTDKHSVTVALSFDEKQADKNGKILAARQARQPWIEHAPISNRAVNATLSPVRNPIYNPMLESRALRRLAQNDAGAQTRVLIELERRRKIREDDRVVARVLGTPLP
jgi:hypothetical protein